MHFVMWVLRARYYNAEVSSCRVVDNPTMLPRAISDASGETTLRQNWSSFQHAFNSQLIFFTLVGAK